ncbi:piwi-like protein Ago3 [Chelonus insularis]|uniref:piwi-like protein Ago3 n=1 Tax=Chelonus insularis TaxID=460826 RepID=UPI00158E4AD3|nr:piwi-like protein Ago3 [Chelonus insularis]
MADPGRGRGRGAALLAMLQKQRSEAGSQDGSSSNVAAASPQSTASATDNDNIPPAEPKPPMRPLGRASLLNIAQKSLSSPGISTLTPPQTPTARGVGRALIQKLCSPPEPVRPGPPPPPPPQQIVRPGLGDQGLPAQMSAISLGGGSTTSSDNPVSRMGTTGKMIDIMSNHINIKVSSGKGIFRYEVKFNPQIDSPSIRNALLNQHKNLLGGTKVFDGIILFIPIRLPKDRIEVESLLRDGTTVKLTIIFQRQQKPCDSVGFFNVLMNRVLKMMNLVRIHRNYFNPRAAHKIEQHHMELWPGYVTAIEEMEGGLKLNIDASHRVMRTDTVRDYIYNTYKQTKDRGNFKETVMKELMGLSVLTRYNNKNYRIDDIIWDKGPWVTFNCKGQEITIAEYFNTHWKLEIKDMKQPLILNRQTVKLSRGETKEEEIYLVPELCYLTGLTDKVRSDFRIMKDLAAVTQVNPDSRRQVIRKFIHSVKSTPEAAKLLEEWGLEMEDDIVTLPGRVLPPEKVFFGNRREVSAGDKADWGSAAVRNQVLRNANMHNWCIAYIQKDERVVNEFCKILRTVCKDIGVGIGEGIKISLKNDSAQCYVTEIRKRINPDLDIVVAICPSNRNDRYSAIKKLCCVESPIKSQVIQTKTISKDNKLKSVTEKIALQMNCKLGGALWALNIPVDHIMIVGMDVYHSGPGGTTRSSVAGFVASLDKSFTTWYSRPYFQRPGQEYIDVLKICFASALTAYRNKRGVYPERIVVYRDGVGDGQLETIASYEIEQLKAAFGLIEPNYSPKLTVIIVQKRINTRLMATVKNQKNRLENPPPGTIVDSCVTRRNWYDFFLVPQVSRQGTVSPTHYIVLVDDAEFDTDQLQRLTFKMCHLYYNWPGTIRVPAPCQYAHKLAYLVGQNIGTEPHEILSDSLYYL